MSSLMNPHGMHVLWPFLLLLVWFFRMIFFEPPTVFDVAAYFLYFRRLCVLLFSPLFPPSPSLQLFMLLQLLFSPLTWLLCHIHNIIRHIIDAQAVSVEYCPHPAGHWSHGRTVQRQEESRWVRAPQRASWRVRRWDRTHTHLTDRIGNYRLLLESTAIYAALEISFPFDWLHAYAPQDILRWLTHNYPLLSTSTELWLITCLPS